MYNLKKAHHNKKVADYKPFKGFYDLRDYNLPKKVFIRLWVIQEYLNHVNERRKYFQRMNAIAWEKAQDMSANYQQCLFSYNEKINK